METKLSMNNVCRTCLSSNSVDMYLLFENSYYNNMCLGEILFNCCAIQTNDNSTCKYICVSCKVQLLSFYKFKKQCEKSEAMLETCVKNNVFLKDFNYDNGPKNYDVPEDLKIKEEIESNHSDDNIDAVESDPLQVPDSDIIKEETVKTTKRTKSKKPQRQNSTTDRPIYECTICSDKFKKLIYLERHVSIHDSATPFNCKECGKCFRKYKNLTLHKKVHTGEKPYLCTTCGKSFALSGNLKSHIRIHSGDKPYSCQECGKSFAQWSSLKSHSVCHSGERSYVCSICGKTFSRGGILSRHMTSHSDEKKYPCNLCNKRFKNSSQRSRHLITHTDEKKYKCTFCGKAFNRSSNLNVHLKIHTGVRPHECPVCEKRFIQLHCLKSHMNTHC